LRKLGWQPRYPLEQGLQDTIREYTAANLAPRVSADSETP
jgi:nucleoside-diphosphate-sugar epimerase